MGKKKQSSNGKGDRNRVSNKEKYDKNWEKIFGNKIRNNNNDKKRQVRISE
tara:strand:+ start:1451 stop:1603 length:153 start_codon:yes stop_codon:yes gene_type:complete